MENFIIFLVMFVTTVGPALVIGCVILGIPITLIVMAACGMKLTGKVILISIAVIFCIPIVAEVIAVVSLFVLFQIFGQG